MNESWHHHILFNREYILDRQEIFGEYLHHTPSQNSGPEEKLAMKEAQSRTSELYVQKFKEPYSLELDNCFVWSGYLY